MKIKTKLVSGVGLLFVFILLLAALSVFFVRALKRDTANIQAANYNSLVYGRNMLSALEKARSDSSSLLDFEANLQKQRGNVTEAGEGEVTGNLEVHFKLLQSNATSEEAISSVRKDVVELMSLNMQAIERKSNIATTTAEQAMFWISIAGSICFLIAFTLLVNLPGNIANPISELTESIKQIANQNYKERVHFESHNEFGELARSFNTMAEKLEEYSESRLDKIIQGKKRIEALINNMHDPVLGLDENRIVLFANEEFLKITGLKEQDLIGERAQDIAVRNDLVRVLIKDLIYPPLQSIGKEPLKIFADEKESYFEKEIIAIHTTPTGEKGLKLIGQVIMLRNITPFKELDFAKTNFIATVSHEFKTPIASIKMSLQLLENEAIGKLNEEQGQLVTSVKEDADRLLKITGELLNITQLESGTIELNTQATDAKDIVNKAVKGNQNQAEKRNISLSTEFRDSDLLVQVDPERTVWVVSNLISNAIRYSFDDAAVTIRAEINDSNLVISVADSGQGIPDEFKDKIFRRYFRVPGTKKEGTGLGLAISKELIEAQGGTIDFVSEMGVGSTFLITLPLVRIG